MIAVGQIWLLNLMALNYFTLCKKLTKNGQISNVGPRPWKRSISDRGNLYLASVWSELGQCQPWDGDQGHRAAWHGEAAVDAVDCDRSRATNGIDALIDVELHRVEGPALRECSNDGWCQAAKGHKKKKDWHSCPVFECMLAWVHPLQYWHIPFLYI